MYLANLPKMRRRKAYEVLTVFRELHLEHKEYEPLFACAKECADKQKKKDFFVM